MHNQATFSRRFFSFIYDAIIFIALLILMGLVYAKIFGLSGIDENSNGHVFYQLYLYGCCLILYVFSCVKRGQTLGMKTWKLSIVNEKNMKPITIQQAVVRFISASILNIFFGFGCWSFVFSKKKQSLPGLLSGTIIVASKTLKCA